MCRGWMCGTVFDTNLTCVFQGRFTIAAKHHITIAEVYESELVDIEKVRRHTHEQGQTHTHKHTHTHSYTHRLDTHSVYTHTNTHDQRCTCANTTILTTHTTVEWRQI